MTIEAILFDLDDTLSYHVARADWDVVTALQVAALAPHCERLGFGQVDLAPLVRQFWAAYAHRFPDSDQYPDLPLEERGWLDGHLALRDVLAESGASCTDRDAAAL